MVLLKWQQYWIQHYLPTAVFSSRVASWSSWWMIMQDHAGSQWDHPWSQHNSAVFYHLFYMIMSDHNQMACVGKLRSWMNHSWSWCFTAYHLGSWVIIWDQSGSCVINQDHHESQWQWMIPHNSSWNAMIRGVWSNFAHQTQNPRFEREDWHQGGCSPKEDG